MTGAALDEQDQVQTHIEEGNIETHQLDYNKFSDERKKDSSPNCLANPDHVRACTIC
jgi:hypothetical protein